MVLLFSFPQAISGSLHRNFIKNWSFLQKIKKLYIPAFTENSKREFVPKFLIVPATNPIHKPITLICINLCNSFVKIGSVHLWTNSFLCNTDWNTLIKKKSQTTSVSIWKFTRMEIESLWPNNVCKWQEIQLLVLKWWKTVEVNSSIKSGFVPRH